MEYTTKYPSPVGTLLLASDGQALTGLWIENQKYYGATLSQDHQEKDDLPVFDEVRKWLDRYFAGEQPSASELPLAPAGSPFRQRVWEIMCRIPYGQTMTYGEIAKEAAAAEGRETMSGQAVGGAVGHNPISIIMPCHRVVGADGSLTGYAGGIDVKRRLLELEGADLSRLYAPKAVSKEPTSKTVSKEPTSKAVSKASSSKKLSKKPASKESASKAAAGSRRKGI